MKFPHALIYPWKFHVLNPPVSNDVLINKIHTIWHETKTKNCSRDIRYGTMQYKQYHTVTYLGCAWDENLYGETMALKVSSKIISKFLLQPLHRLLCNSLIQPHFNYACSTWYPNLNNILKSKLEMLQNKWTCFCLNLNSRAQIGLTEFEKINWLPRNDRFAQFISSMTFKHFNNLSPLYMNDGQNTSATRISLFKLSQPLQKSNHRQRKSFKCST